MIADHWPKDWCVLPVPAQSPHLFHPLLFGLLLHFMSPPPLSLSSASTILLQILVSSHRCCSSHYSLPKPSLFLPSLSLIIPHLLSCSNQAVNIAKHLSWGKQQPSGMGLAEQPGSGLWWGLNALPQQGVLFQITFLVLAI